MMKYKGYIGSVDVDVEDNTLFGKLLHIKDLVNYEADTPAALKAAFEEAVDDYLSDCADRGVEPDRPFKGQFNVRITPELHRELAIAAKSTGKTLNDYVGHVLTCHAEVDANGRLNNWFTQSFVKMAVLNHRREHVSVVIPDTKRTIGKPPSWLQMKEERLATH